MNVTLATIGNMFSFFGVEESRARILENMADTSAQKFDLTTEAGLQKYADNLVEITAAAKLTNNEERYVGALIGLSVATSVSNS